jgi:NAD(P)-dependent dehydrogenase (short-subunit alcohol dehydrogenase family)
VNPRVILITGASRGIGLATATLLTRRGHRVFGTSRTPDQYKHQGFTVLQLDVRDAASVKQCVDSVLERAGHIDVLVNNAGYSLSGAVEEATAEDAQRLFDVNFFGVIRMTNAVLFQMRQSHSGQIINMGSLAGLVGVPYLGIYAASKYALEGYTTSLRYELRAFGLYASMIDAGDIATNIKLEKPSNTMPDYNGVRERATAIHDSNVRNGPPPERVARVIAQAVEARIPRMRYTVTQGEQYWVPWMRRLLPEWLTERIIRSTYKLDQ